MKQEIPPIVVTDGIMVTTLEGKLRKSVLDLAKERLVGGFLEEANASAVLLIEYSDAILISMLSFKSPEHKREVMRAMRIILEQAKKLYGDWKEIALGVIGIVINNEIKEFFPEEGKTLIYHRIRGAEDALYFLEGEKWIKQEGDLQNPFIDYLIGENSSHPLNACERREEMTEQRSEEKKIEATKQYCVICALNLKKEKMQKTVSQLVKELEETFDLEPEPAPKLLGVVQAALFDYREEARKIWGDQFDVKLSILALYALMRFCLEHNLGDVKVEEVVYSLAMATLEQLERELQEATKSDEPLSRNFTFVVEGNETIH